MAVLTDEELMPWWVAAGLDGHPGGCEQVLPEVPGWLLDGPLSEQEPTCDCCGRVWHLAVPTEPVLAEPVVQQPVRWAVPGVWGPEPEQVVPSVGELVGQVQELVGRLGQLDPVQLAPGQALGEAQALFRVQQQLRVQQLARIDDVAERRLFSEAGFRSTNAWVRSVAPDADTRDTTLADRLGRLPVLHEALRSDLVSVTAGRKIAGSLGKVRRHVDRPDGLIDGVDGEQVLTAVVTEVIDLVGKDRFGLETDPALDPAQAAVLAELETAVAAILDSAGSQLDRLEQGLVLLGQYLTPAALPAALEHLELTLLPSILEDRDQTGQDKRALALSSNPDGTWELSGTLTAECGERLHAALAAEARRDPANPLDTAAREAARAAAAQTAGHDPWAAGLDRPGWERRALREQGNGLNPDTDQLVPRSRSKRLHDAFDRLLERYLTHGLGGVHGKVPVQLTATISARTIEGAPGAPPARGATGRPLARSLLRRWWCDAHVTTLLMSRGHKPLGVVHSARTITGTELKAALVQFDNRCAGDGCCPGTPDPLIPLVPHHVKMHALFGQTSLDETILACPTLHQDLHLGKKTIRLRNGRLLHEHGWIEND